MLKQLFPTKEGSKTLFIRQMLSYSVNSFSNMMETKYQRDSVCWLDKTNYFQKEYEALVNGDRHFTNYFLTFCE